MTDTAEHAYPDKYPPGTHWAIDAAWEILDSVKPGVISDDARAFLGGQIAGRLMRERWQPIATAPRDHDVLLWVPPSPLLDGLIAGHVEIGRPSDRATYWMPLPDPPRPE